MSFAWLYDLPIWLFAVLVIGLFIAVSIGGLLASRPLAQRIFGSHPASNEAVGDILQAASAFYGITLGLIAIGAWSSFNDVQVKVSREAAALGALYRDVSMVREPYGAAFTDILREYTRQTIDVAWPAQRRGEIPRGGVAYMIKFQERLSTFTPANKREEVLLGEILDQYNAMTELRRVRLDSVNTSMLPIMWVVVIAGGFVNIAIAFCLVLKRTAGHVVLVTLIASLIGMLLFLTAVLDHPFRGIYGVGPQSFEIIYDHMMTPH